MGVNRLLKKFGRRPMRLVILTFGIVLFLSSVSSFHDAYADGGASLFNDVGDGAFIWGAPNEQTTYIGPYNPIFPATISQLPVSDERFVQKSSDGSRAIQSGVQSGKLNVPADQWKTTKESGLVFGTDGKPYEYTLVESVEPRRHVERRRVRETPPGALQPIWVDKNVERTVWEPVLIRVLRPVNSTIGGVSSPGPCEKNENVSEKVDVQPNMPKEPPVDPDALKQPTLGETSTTYDADGGMTVTLVTRDRNVSQREAPVLVLPNSSRTSRQK